jgi:general secretion pathway protein A
MEQLRQRVIASCHLGPLTEDETKMYIEHRLRHAGWQGAELFSSKAFEPIFASTKGIPRRINKLCTRLLWVAFLSSQARVDERMVLDTASEMLEEVGPLGDAV